MAYKTSFLTRLTRSARGELYNFLIYPFLLSTLAYGVGFAIFKGTDAVNKSSLFDSMHSISPFLTDIWGWLAIAVIVVGVYVLVFDKPPVGRANCYVGFLLWFFAAVIYVLSGGWLTLFSVTVPNLMFWTWQYFSLSEFRRQDMVDSQTMKDYDAGGYDDDNGGRQLRLDNRGVSEDDRTPD